MTNPIMQILFFINPFNLGDYTVIVVIDILTFIILPYILLKKTYKVVWWRSIIFYIGFIMTQVTYYDYPIMEYVFELSGVLLIMFACLARHNQRREVIR